MNAGFPSGCYENQLTECHECLKAGNFLTCAALRLGEK